MATPLLPPGAGPGDLSRPASPTSSALLPEFAPVFANRFLLLPLTSAGNPVEVPIGAKVVLGRRSVPSLNNLHISREQVVFELKPDATGAILICMTNKGKNSTRVLSIGRRKQARVTSNTYCRLVPGDVVELLYDQQGRYAYQLIEASIDGRPILRRTPLVSSVSKYVSPAQAEALLASAASAAAVAPDVGGDAAGGGSGTISWARQWISALMRDPARAGSVPRAPLPRPEPMQVEDTAAAAFHLPRVLFDPSTLLTAATAAGSMIGGMGEQQRAAVVAMIDGMRRRAARGEGDEMEVLGERRGAVAAAGGNDAVEERDADDDDSDGRMAVDNNDARDDDDDVSEDDLTAVRDASRSPAEMEDEALLVMRPRKRAMYSRRGASGGRTGRRAGPIALIPVPRAPAVAVAATAAAMPVAPTMTVGCSVDLPLQLLPHILSCLPLHETMRAGRVCREWRAEVQRSGAVPMVDIGSYFAGVVPPDPLVLDAISSNIRGRDYSFANCLWLTSGALLHALGVPLGATPTAAIPARPRLAHDADQLQRHAAAVSIATGMQGAGSHAVKPVVSPSGQRAAHSYLRAFVGELSPSEEAAAARVAATALGGVAAPPPGQPWWQYIDDVWSHAVEGAAGMSPAQISDAIASMRWGTLDLGDLSLVAAVSEVVRARAIAQYSRMLSTSALQAAPYSDAYGAIVASAYCEMSIACRLLSHRLARTRTALEALGPLPVPPLCIARPLALPAYLNSHRNPLDALSVIGAATIFQPVFEIRRNASAAIAEALAADPLMPFDAHSAAFTARVNMPVGFTTVATQQSVHVPARPVGVAAGAVSAILSEHSTVHALSASFATAAADMFDFAHTLAAAHARASTGGLATPLDTQPVRAGSNILRRLEHCMLSHELPSPAAPARARQGAARHAAEGADAAFVLPNVLSSLPLPHSFATHVTGLDLHGCTRLAPQNLHFILSFCPSLTVLRLGGCTQFSSDLLISIAPLLHGLQQLDLEYCINVNDAVCAALGKHCASLVRLQLVGCVEVTNAGLGASGLLGACTGLRRLNLRGCKSIGDEGIRHLARHAVHLRELCLAGLTQVTAPALADLILGCRKLARFKAELWYDANNQPPPHVLGPPLSAASATGAEGDGAAANRRSYRLLGSVRGAVRYLKQVLTEGDPSLHMLQARFVRDGGGHAEGAAGGDAMDISDPAGHGADGDADVDVTMSMGSAFAHRRGGAAAAARARGGASASKHDDAAYDHEDGGSGSDDDRAQDRFGATTNDVYMHHSIPSLPTPVMAEAVPTAASTPDTTRAQPAARAPVPPELDESSRMEED